MSDTFVETSVDNGSGIHMLAALFAGDENDGTDAADYLNDPEDEIEQMEDCTEAAEPTEVLTPTGKRQKLTLKHGGSGNSTSTARKILPVLKWWKAFRESEGLSADVYPSFIDEDTGNLDNIKTVSFIHYLDEFDPPLSHSQMQNAALFMQYHFNAERKTRGLPIESGAVKKDDVVSTVLNDYRTKRANRCRTDGIDIQADLDNSISQSEMLQLVHSCFDPKHPAIRQMEPLTRLQFCAAFRQTHTTAQRGADLRGQYYNFRTTHPCRYIGPTSTAVMNVIVVNHSKVNRVGRVEYTGFVTRVNPALDSLVCY